MSRIRVLHVVWRLSPKGGEGALVRTVARSLDPERFDVHVCSVRPEYGEDRLDELGSSVTRHHLDVEGPTTLRSRLATLKGVAEVAGRVDPDALHLHSGIAWYALPALVRGAGRARILEVQDSPASGRLTPLNHRVQAAVVRTFGLTVVAHSREVAADLSRSYRLAPETIRRFGLGIDVGFFANPRRERAAVRAELGIDRDAPVVLYVARLVPSKRADLFIDVASRVASEVPTARFILAGQGPCAEELRRQAAGRGLGVHVVFPGFVDDLPSLYAAADCFVSTSEYEGFGLSIAEAQAAGVPVVASAVGGVPDVVDAGRTALLVAPGDCPSLARAVASVLVDEDKRRAMGDAGSAWAARHLDAEDMTEAYADLYEDLHSRG